MPDAFDSSFGSDVTGATRNVFFESGTATMSGIALYDFGFGSARIATVTALSNCEYSLNGGNYGTGTGSGASLIQGATLKIRVQASSSFNTPTTGSITITDQASPNSSATGNLVVTSMADPGSGGSTGGGETGTSGYGFKVLNGNGVSVVNQTSRATNFIVASNVTIGAGATTAAISCEGMTASNSDEVGVIVVGNLGQFVGFQIQVNRGTNSFTIKNNASTQIKIYYYGVRY